MTELSTKTQKSIVPSAVTLVVRETEAVLTTLNAQASSSLWQPIALFLVVLLALIFLCLVLGSVGIICTWRKKKKKKKEKAKPEPVPYMEGKLKGFVTQLP